ncbi:hypothetical protein [Carboxylicivirga linearis]|uniref:Lipoprotein n=1 Tax=Carboxylicivirga linearis TaxID=1628157 RepID=A0ABS5JT99_9BACT|nr:hypothetical protein [Carboxylicivirga linearis]MBS2098048.1 hypothetical protein [Carboxylicivirga linearis]
MKNLTFIVAISLAIFNSCTSTPKQSNQQQEIILVDHLIEKADDNIDSLITIKGHVTHTCKHSGKRAFLVGDNEDFTVRVEAGGEITGFDQNLIGSTLVVSGTLKERRLTKEYIDQWEDELKDKAEEDGSAESCATEMNNIKDMRTWMKNHNKDHYSIYYVEGMNYEVVE